MKIVQVGVGKMGRAWMKAFATTEDVELAGIVEPVVANREWAMAEYGLVPSQCFDSVDAALVMPRWDAAVIVTPPPSHYPLAGQLLRAGKHVLLEKPLATSIEDARALVGIAEETGRTLMVAQNYRYHDAFSAVRPLVASGRIGTVRAVNIQFQKDGRTIFGEGDFRYAMKHVLLVDMSIHHFDMVRAMLGTNPERVYAQTWHVPGGVFEFDAAASVLITMEDGALVSYVGNWAAFDRETSWNGDWEIVGDRGRIVWAGGDFTDAGITVREWGKEPDRITFEPLVKGGQLGLLEAFASAIASGTHPETAAADNVHSLGIVFAAVESAETGQVVQLG
ncbi:MAG: Gfo/Idh/MocA family oxidoreductase [Chloroflexia bacterium]|nr:Gfo/Idh/MocA family oxidoreductase [Chloroflexia bacterium]